MDIEKGWFYCENCDREFLWDSIYENFFKRILEAVSKGGGLKDLRAILINLCPKCKNPIKELNFH